MVLSGPAFTLASPPQKVIEIESASLQLVLVLVKVQDKKLVWPKSKLVIVLLLSEGLFALLPIQLALTNLQLPVSPTEGAVAFKFFVPAQKEVSFPAFGLLGVANIVIVTVSKALPPRAQLTPISKVKTPPILANPDKRVLRLVGLLMVSDGPLSFVHKILLVAAKGPDVNATILIALLAQWLLLTPAFTEQF